MADDVRLMEQYSRAKCCAPSPPQKITGYFSHDRVTLKVHRSDCSSLDKAPPDRLVRLEWDEILAPALFRPEDDYHQLSELDWRVMQHHEEYGNDYSHKVARVLHADRQQVFESHNGLRNLGLLERVEPLIIQYRKGIVDNKWIKHRNHTYYELTPKGRDYLAYRARNRA